MKLMVDDLLEVLEKTQKILQQYKGQKTVDMLDDIYRHCCGDVNNESESLATTSNYQPAKKSGAKGKRRRLNNEADIALLQEELKGLKIDEALEILNCFTKNDLILFADTVSISVTRTGNKDVITGQIGNHYNFGYVSNEMEQRPPMQR